MVATCELCKNDFLTEADPHVVHPTRGEYRLYCNCMVKKFKKKVEPINHFDSLIADYQTGETVKMNESVARMTKFYSSDLLRYIEDKHGTELALEIAKSIIHSYEYQLND